MPYYDDNFGFWDENDDPEEMEHFREYVARNSVEKTCDGCGRRVKLMPQYGYCDSCATKREQGWDI